MPSSRVRPILAPVLLLAAAGLGGCQSNTAALPTLPGSAQAAAAALPHDVPSKPVKVDRFHSPATLAGLKADGSITRDKGDGWKQWRYRDAHTLMKVTIYGLPGGWRAMSPKDIVSGHYGQLRQRKVHEIYNSADKSLKFVNEREFNLDGHETVISQMLINAPNRTPLYEVLLLTVDGNHFTRLDLLSDRPSTKRLANLAKRALTEFRKENQEQAASNKEQREKSRK